MSKTKAERERDAEDKARAIEILKGMCRPGTIVYTSCDYVSSSGMSRRIHVYVADKKDREIVTITGWVARILGYRRHKHGGMIVGGGGMDMGYHVVNSLSYALHGHKDRGDDAKAAGGRPFSPRPGHYRAGYSLNHRWL